MSFPKYPAYKESGVEWIGKIPAGWGVAPLFSISTENREKNTGLKSSNTLSLSYGNIIERDKNNNFGLLPDSYETYQIVKFGDIIFRLTDLQNDKNSLRSAISRYNGIITSAYLSIKTSKNCCPFYISYLMRAYDCEKVFYSMGGGVRQSLNFKEFKYLPVILPPLPEQQAIARFLDHECGKIDALIAEQKRLIALLAEKRQAVISHAVTKGLNPNAPMKDSGIPWIGMVPEGWEVLSLRHCSIRIQTGTTPAEVSSRVDFDQGFLWYTPGDFGDTIDLGMSARTIPSDRIFDMGTRVFPAESVLVVGIGATLGKVGFTSMPCSANQQINAIIPNKKVLGRFLAYSLYVKSDIMKYFSNSSTIGIMNQEKTKEIPIAIPLISEQKEIIKILDKTMIDHISMINDASSAITLLKERRAALISAAVTGKIDVRAQSKAIAA